MGLEEAVNRFLFHTYDVSVSVLRVGVSKTPYRCCFSKHANHEKFNTIQLKNVVRLFIFI